MRWITRERIRVDRVASAWLIRRFVDEEATFFFVPGDEVLAEGEARDPTPFHVPGAALGQGEGRPGFEAIIAAYHLGWPGGLPARRDRPLDAIQPEFTSDRLLLLSVAAQ